MTNDNAALAGRRTQRSRRGWLVFLRDILVIILIAVAVSFLIKTFVVRSFFIPSSSMENTLLVKDRILVDELTTRWTGYERGDIVVFKDPGGWLPPPAPTPPRPPLVEGADWVLTQIGISATDSEDHLVKRIIGLPGDHVVCCNALGQVSVNGSPIDELGYIKLPPGDTMASDMAFDVAVPSDAIWVLGDNRDRSQDSRFHQELPGAGFVPVDNIVGRAFLITWPLERFGLIDSRHAAFNGVKELAK